MAQKKRGRGRPPADTGGTRDALLAAATEVFAERGFEGATTDLIARRARANAAMIHYHFRSKKALYAAILEDTFSHLERALAGARTSQRSAPQQLREFIAAFVQMARARPSFPAMMLRELVGGGEHLNAEALARFIKVVGVIAGILEQGVREGSFRRAHPLYTHVSVVAPMVMFLSTAALRGRIAEHVGLPAPEVSLEGFVAHMQELMTRGLAAEPAAQNRRER